MSFSGKRYKRTGGSNLDEFLKATPEHFKRILMSDAPTWSYTMLDTQTIQLKIHTGGFYLSHTFKLDVEHELLRVDGSKAYMTYTLEGDNTLKQKIRKPNGLIAHFKREFHERTATMTITMEGADVRKAHVFYEVVD